MARKSKANDLKAKQARQKKLLAVLGVVMVALAVIQVPKVLHHKSGNLDTLTQSVTTTPLTTTPGTLSPPTLGGGTDTTAAPTAPVTTPAASPTTETSGLADTSGTPVASYGQLVQFDLFASKDPFIQQVNNPADASAATSPGNNSAATGGRSPTTTTTTTGETTPFTPPSTSGGTTTTGPAVPMTAVAMLSVNGNAEPIPTAHDFPTAEPIFHLVSYTTTSAKISVVGGSYQSGAATLELVKGQPMTLQNTVSGTTYKVEFLGAKKVPTDSLPKPAAQAPAATTTATTATVPTTAPTGTTATIGTATTG